MRVASIFWLALAITPACSEKKPSPKMYAGDCNALETKVSSQQGLAPETADTAVKMCAEGHLTQSDADCLLKAPSAQEADWCVKEALKWMEHRK
jgi:hypothetical protein